jgi:hypothetical protein
LGLIKTEGIGAVPKRAASQGVTANALKLAPCQHAEQLFAQIWGWAAARRSLKDSAASQQAVTPIEVTESNQSKRDDGGLGRDFRGEKGRFE